MADDSRNCRNCYPVSDTDVQVKCLVHYYSTTTIAATTTTKNVRIIVLPSHSCGGTLQGLHLKLLHSSTQTSADGLNGQRQVSRMTDEKAETWSPSEMSKVRSRTSLWWQTVPCTLCSHRKGMVAKGSLTSRWHLQCRGVSRVETATTSDGSCRLSDRYVSAVSWTQW